MIKWIKRSIYFGLAGFLLVFGLIYFANNRVVNISKPYVFSDINKVPSKKVGLLLGTSKFTGRGSINQYYAYRLNATIKLYETGKIEFILVSGDNGTRFYNEPETIKKDLIKRGVPAEKIFLDYAGFRTYDSVVRANEIFGQKSFVVISQEFHNQRAIYLARSKGLDVYGYNAKSVGASYGFKTMQREKLAKVKAVLDVLLNKQPKFLGDKITIE